MKRLLATLLLGLAATLAVAQPHGHKKRGPKGEPPATQPVPQATGACLSGKPLRGVNMAGAEFNSTRMPGQVFKDYTYPTDKDLKYFAEQGANVIRLPFRWERVQRELGGPLDELEVKVIRKVVEMSAALNLCVILDAHNFGQYAKQKLGSPELPPERFTDFWLRMREAFPDPGFVAFGLMNEPAHVTERGGWVRAAQDVVTALRDAGSKHLLFVSGAGWSGAHDWAVKWQGLSNADAFASLKDPLKLSVIEVHQYADKDHSGMKADCMAPERMKKLMDRVTDWAKANGHRMFLGEFGVAPTPECLDTLKALLESMRDPAWAGWAYWAAGGWWGPKYTFGIHPIPGQPERPQLALLREEWKP